MATVVVNHTPSGGPADSSALVDGPTYDNDPHIVTGLENVDNTADLDKPISTATQTALDAKANTFTLTTTGSSGAATYSSNVLNIPQYSGGGTPGGSTTQVQYNNAGAFGGISGATTNGTTLTLVAPVLGTPASVTLTNATGLPVSTGISGLGTGVATFLATPSSANLRSALTDETGTGAAVFGTAPTISQPNLVGTTTNDNASAGNFGEYIDTGTGNNNATATVTMTIASPCVVTWTNHKFTLGTTTALRFTTTGALPTGLTAGTTYYLKPIDANTFNVATTAANALAGTFINTSGSQSGTHTGDVNVSLVAATAQDVAAVSLTAGDWDVSGQILVFTSATTTVTFVGGGLSLVSNTIDRTWGRRLSIDFSNNTQVPGNSEYTVFNIGPARFSLSATTTIFAHAQSNFGTSTAFSAGWIRARRIR